ncbi:MAG: site-2 protease family protein [Candidatus Abyssubacteria bacterium]
MDSHIVSLIVLYVVLLFSCCVHEFAHAWTANMCGDDTARLMGRMTLNPVVHIDPLGTVIFPLLAIIANVPFLLGWAKPVPINPTRFQNYRRDDMIVSLAGIGSNLLLALFAATILRSIYVFGLTVYVGPVVYILKYLMVINVVLAVFNLIPIPPLDGSHVLYHYLPLDTATQFRRLEQYGFLILIFFLMTGIFGKLLVLPLEVFRSIAGPLGF